MSEPAGTPPRVLNALTVDVEEHFQVSAFENCVSREEWAAQPSRVAGNTERLLDLFDETGVKATFFILGWVAERRPELVRRIHERGHEIGSHGYDHKLAYSQTREEFRRETELSKQLLEDASGGPVRGYRSASFSVRRDNLWVLEVLAEAGFEYDSSVFPVLHDRYGIPSAPRRIYHLRVPGGNSIVEVPPSTVLWARLRIPVAGGGYLRILPEWVSRWAIRRLNRRERMPAVVYTHPWEVDPQQPRVGAPLLTRWRHYTGIARTEGRLRRLIELYRFGPVEQVIRENGAGELVTLEGGEFVVTADRGFGV